MYELPIFPLHMVLFPGMPLQLHIFEERYKIMLQDCRKENKPFGVVLIKHGKEVGDQPVVPYEFGCSARILEIEPLEEGRFNLEGIGVERFRIQRLKYDQPFLVGMVDDVPLVPGDEQNLPGLQHALRPRLQKYIQLIAQGRDVSDTVERIPDDPVVMAYLAAMVLQVPLHQKQHFLEIGDCANLLTYLDESYRREVSLIKRILATMPSEGAGHFSRN